MVVTLNVSWVDLERGKDPRAAMGLPLVLSPVLLGTLRGDTFKFRSGPVKQLHLVTLLCGQNPVAPLSLWGSSKGC